MHRICSRKVSQSRDRRAGEGGRHCTDEMQISHVCGMWTIVLEGFST